MGQSHRFAEEVFRHRTSSSPIWLETWSIRWNSNPQPRPWQGRALTNWATGALKWREIRGLLPPLPSTWNVNLTSKSTFCLMDISGLTPERHSTKERLWHWKLEPRYKYDLIQSSITGWDWHSPLWNYRSMLKSSIVGHMSKNNYGQLYENWLRLVVTLHLHELQRIRHYFYAKPHHEKSVQADHNVFQSCSWELQQPDASTFLLVAFSERVPESNNQVYFACGWLAFAKPFCFCMFISAWTKECLHSHG